MRKSKAIILFSIFVASSFAFSWRFIQSEYVGEIVSKKITELIQKNENIKVNFKKVGFSLWPLGTQVKHINLELEDQDVSINASNISINFGIIDLLSSELVISRIDIDDSLIKIGSSQVSNNEFKPEDIYYRKIFLKTLSTLKKDLPVRFRRVTVNDSYIHKGPSIFRVKHLSSSVFNEKILLRGSGNIQRLNNDKIIDENLKKTSFGINIEFSENNISIKDLKVVKGINNFVFKGECFPRRLILSSNCIGNGDMNFDLVDVQKFQPEFSKFKGVANLKFTIDSLKERRGSFELSINDYLTTYLKGDYTSIAGEIKNNKLFVKNLMYEKDGGFAKLEPQKSIPIFDIEKKELIKSTLPIDTSQLFSNDFLYVIDSSVEPLKFKLSGLVNVGLSKDGVRFLPENSSRVSELFLKIDENEILRAKSDFTFKDFNLYLDSDFNLTWKGGFLVEDSFVQASGGLDSNGIKTSINADTIDLNKFLIISNQHVKGNGKLKVNVSGPWEDVNFKFEVDQTDFEVFNFKLGKVSGDLYLGLKDKKLYSRLIRGENEKVKYTTDLLFEFGEKKFYKMIVSVKEGDFNGLRHVMNPIFPDFILNNDSINFSLYGGFSVLGDLTNDELRVAGSIIGKNIDFYDEDFNHLSTEFVFEKGVLSFDEIILRKNRGAIKGDAFFNVKSQFFEYSMDASGFVLSELNNTKYFNSGLKGNLYGEFVGSGNINNFSTRSQLSLTNSSLGGKRLKDSFLTVYNNHDDIFIASDFLGGVGKVEAFLKVSNDSKKQKRSFINLKVKESDIRNLFGIISEHNIFDRNLSGSLDFNLEASFDIDELNNLDLKANINEFNFIKNGEEFKVQNGKKSIKIENGQVINWDIDIRSNDHWLKSYAEKEGKNIKVFQGALLPFDFIGLLDAKVEIAKGQLFLRNVLVTDKTSLSSFVEARGNNIFLKNEALPTYLKDMKFSMVMDNKELILEYLEGYLGRGYVRSDARIILNFPYPEIDLYLNIRNANIPFLKSSDLTFSSSIDIVGKKPPYLLTGFVKTFEFNLRDDLEQLQDQKWADTGYLRYVPKNSNRLKSAIETDLVFSSVSPVHIINQLADIHLDSKLFVTGNLDNPSISGGFEINKTKLSKFMFKGNDFDLNFGEIKFNPENEAIGPIVNFKAASKISDYNVLLDVNGPINEININLASDPSLSQEDIFSLLALGYTSNETSNLQSGVQDSVTNFSLGSLIFDQLKINDGLGKTMGLRLSLESEFENESESLLTGLSDGTSSRTRSTTKVKIKKKVNDKMSMSLSTSLGGNLDKSQEMNVNYDISDIISVEGVYEINSSEFDEIDNENSFGADLKFRWNF